MTHPSLLQVLAVASAWLPGIREDALWGGGETVALRLLESHFPSCGRQNDQQGSSSGQQVLQPLEVERKSAEEEKVCHRLHCEIGAI